MFRWIAAMIEWARDFLPRNRRNDDACLCEDPGEPDLCPDDMRLRCVKCGGTR